MPRSFAGAPDDDSTRADSAHPRCRERETRTASAALGYTHRRWRARDAAASAGQFGSQPTTPARTRRQGGSPAEARAPSVATSATVGPESTERAGDRLARRADRGRGRERRNARRGIKEGLAGEDAWPARLRLIAAASPAGSSGARSRGPGYRTSSGAHHWPVATNCAASRSRLIATCARPVAGGTAWVA
jgi:hypothetical protein